MRSVPQSGFSCEIREMSSLISALRRCRVAKVHPVRVTPLPRDGGRCKQWWSPAIEGGARPAGPKLQEQLVNYFGCRFDDLFEVVLVDPETGREQVLQPR